MKDNINMFDRQLNDRLSNEELPFDEKAWEMMEEKLDGNKKGLLAFWNFQSKYLFVAIGIILISSAVYWPIHYYTSSNSLSTVNTSNPTLIEEQNSMKSTELHLVEDSVSLGLKNDDPPVTENTQSEPYYYQVKVSNDKPTKNFSNSNIQLKSNELVFNKDARIKGVALTGGAEDKLIVEQLEKSGTVSQEDLTIIKEVVNQQAQEVQLEKIAMINPQITEEETTVPLGLKLVKTGFEPEGIINRPKNQINIALGGGMTQLTVGDPEVGLIKPVATARQEYFYSLGYLRRFNNKFGLELGYQLVRRETRIGHYFKDGDYGLTTPMYGEVDVPVRQTRYELFANLHYFLPLNQRSELDFYAGYYAHNPFEAIISWDAVNNQALNNSEGTNLISSSASGNQGVFGGGRLKLGLNYSFLTNKRNTIGVGISYMQQIIKENDASYQLFQSSDESKVFGDLKASTSGFKIQVNYGFGLNKKYSETKTSKGLRNPWYAGIRWGTKSYQINQAEDPLSRIIVKSFIHKYSSIYLGHYIKERLAIEFGAEYYSMLFSTPANLDPNVVGFRGGFQEVISVPFALRYDLIQKNRFIVYGKGVISTDFKAPGRLPSDGFFGIRLGQETGRDKLLLNAGLETGIDVKLFKGLHLGLQGKYNYAFNQLTNIRYPKSFAENEYVFEDIKIRNSYFSWGVELKYFFNRK